MLSQLDRSPSRFGSGQGASAGWLGYLLPRTIRLLFDLPRGGDPENPSMLIAAFTSLVIGVHLQSPIFFITSLVNFYVP